MGMLGGRRFALLVAGAALMAGLCAMPAYAATPQPTPSWKLVKTFGSNNCYAYSTCWVRGTISPYKYIGGATGVKSSPYAAWAMSTKCAVQLQSMSTGAWSDRWTYPAVTRSNTKGPVTYQTPDPGGPWVDGRYAWRARTKNTGYFQQPPYVTFYFTLYSTTIPY